MRVFLDECIDWRLSRLVAGHDVGTARDAGWTGLKNGELLARVALEFEVFVTVDRNLAFQQHVPSLSIAVIVLHARTNRLADLKALVPELLRVVPAAKPGTVTVVADRS